jgi:ech hydrogenase subunit A
MQTGWMMAIALLLPVIFAFGAYIIRDYRARGAVVIAAAAVLSVNAVMMLKTGPFQFTPESEIWNTVIMVLDFAMLIYFIVAAVTQKSVLIFVFSIAQLIPLAYWEFVMKAHPEVKPAFVVDYLAIIMVLIISVIGSLICVYGIRYIEDHEHHAKVKDSRQSRFLFWMVIFLGAMNGLVCANNLYWLYFFWEITTLCSFLLIGHDLTKEALKNASRALWINSIGGTTFVIAMIFLYTQAGGSESLSMQNLLKAGSIAPALAAFPIVLLCITGFTKAAQLPFQSWLLGAMVAPTPVSALLHSSTMVKAGVYLIVRLAPSFSTTNLGSLGAMIGELVALVGAFTFLAASALAISQTTGKRVLAYSTIANLGLIIACAGLNTPMSIAAALLLIIFHAISKALLFLCAGTIEHIIWSREIDDMEALADKAPMTSLITALGILSMFLPPFGMLLGKWMALESAASISKMASQVPQVTVVALVLPLIVIALFFVVASAATIVFWSKWLGRLMQVLPRVEHKRESMSIGYAFPLWFLLAGIVVATLFVTPMYSNFLTLAVNNVVHGSQVVPLEGSMWVEAVPPGSTGMPVAIGNFPVILLTLILVAALVVPFLLISLKPKELRPVYLCGEQTGSLDSDQYVTAADQKVTVQLGGLYYQKFLGEAALNPWVNTIAVNLIILLFAVALGVTIR